MIPIQIKKIIFFVLVYTILSTQKFTKKFEKFDNSIKSRFYKHQIRLKDSPLDYGRPLGVDWIREIKIQKFRFYYVVFKEKVMMLWTDISEKKNQQEIIEFIKDNILLLKEYVDKL